MRSWTVTMVCGLLAVVALDLFAGSADAQLFRGSVVASAPELVLERVVSLADVDDLIGNDPHPTPLRFRAPG